MIPTPKIETRGRKKIYASQAERQKAYIERNQIDEAAIKREWRRNNPSDDVARLIEWKLQNPERVKQSRLLKEKRERKERRMQRQFIAFDGEGINTNRIQTYLRSADEDINGMPVYKQNYVLLTSSDGRYIENWKDGLSTEECLDFLLSYQGENYLIGFGIGYDVTKMLADLNEKQLRKLWKVGFCNYKDYYINYTPNKIFRVTKKDDKSITLYDTRAFFQTSFVKALKDWEIPVPKIIQEGKESRSTFDAKQKQKIKKYNLLECELLVTLMNKMRSAMATVDIVPYRWYGVGAMAEITMRDHYVKNHIETPTGMTPKFLEAYYGGRNQVMQLGEFDGSVFLHDINSAYPHAMTELPSSIGSWSESNPKFYNYPYTLYNIEWDLPESTLITPFPVRRKGNIYYPLKGSGTYWQPEISAAMQHYSEHIKIKQVWFFEPNEPDVRPFDFYKEYYAQRQEFIKQGNDAQKVLKLALNAGYGKVAQSIGGRVMYDPVTQEVTYSVPAYQNYFWAGMITSKCRAKVFELAMLSPESIIAFATDGVASTRKLTEHSEEKELGAWEVKEVQNYFIAQTGVYTYKDGDVEKFRSRGFGYKSIDYNLLREQWRATTVDTVFYYTENRFIGIGQGLQRNHFELIGSWLDVERKLLFTPQSMRVGNDGQVIQLLPPFDMGHSEPYKKKASWLDQLEAQEIQDDLDQIK